MGEMWIGEKVKKERKWELREGGILRELAA